MASGDATARTSAYSAFGFLVRQGGPWDPKPELGKKRGWYEEPLYTTGSGPKYYYDVYGNVMFGFFGKQAGFSEDALMEGAGAEQIGSSFGYAVTRGDPSLLPKRRSAGGGLRAYDDYQDVVGTQIGFQLYEFYGLAVDPMDIAEAIQSASGLATAN